MQQRLGSIIQLQGRIKKGKDLPFRQPEPPIPLNNWMDPSSSITNSRTALYFGGIHPIAPPVAWPLSHTPQTLLLPKPRVPSHTQRPLPHLVAISSSAPSWSINPWVFETRSEVTVDDLAVDEGPPSQTWQNGRMGEDNVGFGLDPDLDLDLRPSDMGGRVLTDVDPPLTLRRAHMSTAWMASRTRQMMVGPSHLSVYGGWGASGRIGLNANYTPPSQHTPVTVD